MGVFKLNQSFCDSYEKIIRDFWWGDKDDHRKVHWMAWENMTKPKRDGGIGFRDMHLFNQALLARQGWRLLQNPDSLCARVLKSKYYPNGELVDTVFASDASPAWRGIEFGLELLKKGLIWRVGNGRKIQIVRDQWIPRSSGLKTASYIRRSRLRWVNQLILPDSREWNTDLIRQIFHSFDADEICKIRIPAREVEDCIAWHYEKTGVFTVKSAYKLADMLERNGTEGPSSSTSEPGDRTVWDVIWKAKIPERIKIFGWRVATQSLATKHNTHRRTIVPEDICDNCGTEPEDEFHAVISCTRSKALRNGMRSAWDLPKEQDFSKTGKNWLQCLLIPLPDHVRNRTLMILWKAWQLRNNVIHGDGKDTVTGAMRQLVKLDEDLDVAANGDEKTGGKGSLSVYVERICKPAVSGTNQWTPPPRQSAKLNSDAAFLPEFARAWGGAVARDHKGTPFLSVAANYISVGRWRKQKPRLFYWV